MAVIIGGTRTGNGSGGGATTLDGLTDVVVAASDPGAVGAGVAWLDKTSASAPVWRMRNAGDTGWVPISNVTASVLDDLADVTVAASDPGAVGAGKIWLDTTTAVEPLWKMRNAANTGWVYIRRKDMQVARSTKVESLPKAFFNGITAFGTANAAYAFRVRIPNPTTVTTGYWYTGATSGNVDVGIYSSADGGTTLDRIASTGTQGAGTANALNSAALSSSPVLVPDTDYWLAIAADNTTLTIPRLAVVGNFIIAERDALTKTTAFVLPTTLSSLTAATSYYWVAVA